MNGDGGAERRVRQSVVQNVSRFEGSRLRIRGIRQLAKLCGPREAAAVQCGATGRSDDWAQRFRKLDDGLTTSRMRDPHDDLAGSHYLSGLDECFDHYAVGIGTQHRVVRLIAGNFSLRFGGIELGRGGLSRGFHLVVGRGGNRATSDEVAVARLILRGLAGESARGGNGLGLCAHRELEIHGIDAHEHLAPSDRLPRIHRALEHFPRDAKPQIALHTRGDDAGERASRLDVALDAFDSNQRRLSPRVGR